jgi:hypothetical protein
MATDTPFKVERERGGTCGLRKRAVGCICFWVRMGETSSRVLIFFGRRLLDRVQRGRNSSCLSLVEALEEDSKAKEPSLGVQACTARLIVWCF